MADTGGANSKKKLPSVYSAMADMGSYGPQAPKPGGGPAGAGAGAPSAEKQQSAVALLEVIQKMERMETEAANKDLLQQMVTLAQQYMDKISPGGAKAAGAGTGADSSAAPAPPAPEAAPPAPPAAGAGMTP